jgi:uncharacterized membrane protein
MRTAYDDAGVQYNVGKLSMASPIKQILLHDSFRVGITLKGLDGVLEILASIALYSITPAKMTELVKRLVEHMLSRMPNGYLAAHLISASQKLNNDSRQFAIFYLLAHGSVKVVLVVCLWLNRLWAYPLTIAIFGLFMLYQMGRFAHTHSITMVLLTIFDGVVIYLTWVEFQQQKKKRFEQHRAQETVA